MKDPVVSPTIIYMEWVKKIAAGILMLLAALGLLLCLAGVFGVLAINSRVSNAIIETIDTADGYFTTIEETINNIHTRLTSLDENVDRIKDQLEETTISDAEVLRAINNQIDTSDMERVIEDLIITARAISDGLAAINAGLVALNQIPVVNLPTISEELAALDDRVEGLRAEFEEIQTGLTSSQDIKNRLLQPVNRLSENLNQVESSLAEGQSNINEVRASLSSTRIGIPRLIGLSGGVLVLVFVLFGAGQVLLFERAWKWFKSSSPRRSQQMPSA
ncbi:MAG: hypothetical protein EHM41_16980 [Chloroflexi bacterium]|nr:MAG: hypothetical protein EHM41_16980 [Chloroflexota bacterium]